MTANRCGRSILPPTRFTVRFVAPYLGCPLIPNGRPVSDFNWLSKVLTRSKLKMHRYFSLWHSRDFAVRLRPHIADGYNKLNYAEHSTPELGWFHLEHRQQTARPIPSSAIPSGDAAAAGTISFPMERYLIGQTLKGFRLIAKLHLMHLGQPTSRR